MYSLEHLNAFDTFDSDSGKSTAALHWSQIAHLHKDIRQSKAFCDISPFGSGARTPTP
jgi:hypothetical protein